MLTAEQEEQRKRIDNAVVYIMENRIKGNLVLSFPGNGCVGGQGKFENFFTIGKGETPLKDMERLRFMEKNITNREAAKSLESLPES